MDDDVYSSLLYKSLDFFFLYYAVYFVMNKECLLMKPIVYFHHAHPLLNRW